MALRPFALVDEATGKILQTFDERPDRAHVWAKPGQLVIEGRYDQARHSFDPAREFVLVVSLPAAVLPSIDDMKAEARRRLALTDWMIVRAADPTGKSVPAVVLEERAAVRRASALLEALDPIPVDYRDDKWWRP